MERITEKMIDAKLKTLNLLTGASVEPYKNYRDSEGHIIQNKGHYYLQGCYGAFKIEQMAEKGSNDITPLGTKREVYNQVKAMIEGIYAYKEMN